MERITIRNFRYEDNEFAPHLVDFPLCAALAKLQKYEDTGLSPDDVARMVHDKETGKLKEMPAEPGFRLDAPYPPGTKFYAEAQAAWSAAIEREKRSSMKIGGNIGPTD